MSSPHRPTSKAYDDSKRQSRRLDNSNVKNKNQQEFNHRLYVTKGITEEDVLMLKEVFDTIDVNGRGYLTPSDIKFSLQKNGFNANKQTVYDIVAEYDEKEEGGLGFAEFMKIMSSQPAEEETREDVRRIFRKYDRKNKGYIEAQDIMNVVKEVREEMSREEIDKILHKASCKHPGRLSLDEFYRMMTNLHFQ